VFSPVKDDDELCDEAVNPSQQLTEQMETPQISFHKHTHSSGQSVTL